MISAQFIEFDSHPGTLLNVSHITAVEKTAGAVSGKKRKAYEALGMSAAVLYTIRVSLVGRDALDLAFDSEELCAATFKLIKMALTPHVIPKPALSAKPANTTATKKPKPLRATSKSPKGEA